MVRDRWDSYKPRFEALIGSGGMATQLAALSPAAATQLAASDDAQLTTNPRLALFAAGNKRREALGGLLTRYIDSISAGTYREESALIADAQLDMRLARSFASASAPTPGQSHRIYLPLVAR